MIATADYDLVTGSAGLIDRSARARVLLGGADAVDFLQGQVTNDVAALAPGEGCYAAILNHKGKLRTDLRILRGEDWVWVDTEEIGGAVLQHTVKTYSLGRQVTVDEAGSRRAILSLVGPGADAALDVAPPEAEHSFVEGAPRALRPDSPGRGRDLRRPRRRAGEPGRGGGLRGGGRVRADRERAAAARATTWTGTPFPRRPTSTTGR